jgi:hypothetical protein
MNAGQDSMLEVELRVVVWDEENAWCDARILYIKLSSALPTLGGLMIPFDFQSKITTTERRVGSVSLWRLLELYAAVSGVGPVVSHRVG